MKCRSDEKLEKVGEEEKNIEEREAYVDHALETLDVLSDVLLLADLGWVDLVAAGRLDHFVNEGLDNVEVLLARHASEGRHELGGDGVTTEEGGSTVG